MPSRDRPFLLTMPEYGGTLAAARCLGSRGIRVTMAGDSWLAPARWSRHVSHWITSPPVSQPERFLDWLLEFGRTEPGHVLYPTCDDLAWLIADRGDELGQYYQLYQPSAQAILRLLDKKALHEVCKEVGIDRLPTAFPRGPEEALQAADEVGYPILLKPRTQVLFTTRSKGRLVERPEALLWNYTDYFSGNSYHPTLSALLSDVRYPMLQAYRPHAASGIYSLSGFVSRHGQGIAARASIKILQRPRGFGVGLCFEEAPVDSNLLDRVLRLCQTVGYFGVFEAEFVRDGSHLQLIDFNPRFYGQMGFEIARDLPLAYLVWLGALGEDQALARALAAAGEWREGRGYAYCHRFFLEMTLSLQHLSGRMGGGEVQRWRDWFRTHSDQALLVDAVNCTDDPMPGRIAALKELYRAGRYPRSFVRSIVLDAT